MVELFSLHKNKLELQTYELRHPRNFLYHVLAFRTLFKNMTPKEKALELYYGFDKLIYFNDQVNCKDCALLCVDKIISENHFLDNFKVEFTSHLVKRIDFWEQVRAELLQM
jgi:Pyruvate/2-oxoacid:ferredoxin oxidoreductase delta subunit